VHVSLVQAASTLEPTANRARLAELTPQGADLVVFPEAFARDFGAAGSPLGEYAEPADGDFGAELAAVADARDTTIVAGMFERSDDPARPFNTLLVRGRARAAYRKIHLYDSFGHRESDQLRGGALEPVTFELDGFTVGLMTCYDLRFPELARALVVEWGADVLLLPAAWVAGPRKVDHWLTLTRARAIENTAYVVAAGQPGPRYTGHSLVFDPYGDLVAEAADGETVLHAELDPDLVRQARETNPSLANRRL
jgi:predicted amidohydrolase